MKGAPLSIKNSNDQDLPLLPSNLKRVCNKESDNKILPMKKMKKDLSQFSNEEQEEQPFPFS